MQRAGVRKAGSYKNLTQSNRAYFNRKVELYHEIITGNNELDVLMFMQDVINLNYN